MDQPQHVDFEQEFHKLAQLAQVEEQKAQTPQGLDGDTKARLVQILQTLKGKSKDLQGLAQSNPKLFSAITGTVHAMLAMAQGKKPDLQKGWPKDEAENTENANTHAVLQDWLEEKGRPVKRLDRLAPGHKRMTHGNPTTYSAILDADRESDEDLGPGLPNRGEWVDRSVPWGGQEHLKHFQDNTKNGTYKIRIYSQMMDGKKQHILQVFDPSDHYSGGRQIAVHPDPMKLREIGDRLVSHISNQGGTIDNFSPDQPLGKADALPSAQLPLGKDKRHVKGNCANCGKNIALERLKNAHREPLLTEGICSTKCQDEYNKQLDKAEWWHGSPSGDLRGGPTGLHLGSRKAAEDALHARIGYPVEGVWDGTREYGKTLIAGRKTLRARGLSETGINCGDHPEEDHYPIPGRATFGDGSAISLGSRPVIQQLEITGPMSNNPYRPHEDFKANGYMQGQLKRGTAKRGYYYSNQGEDVGSVSATVPGPSHVRPVTKAESGYHESPEEVSEDTKELHRALTSLKEELEAVDWYQQRIDATGDARLKEVLQHNQDEEKEHASALIQWLIDKDLSFAAKLLGEEELDKAAPNPGAKGRHHQILPVGAQLDAGPNTNHVAGRLKIKVPFTGQERWRQVRSGVVMAPDGSPASARNPNVDSRPQPGEELQRAEPALAASAEPTPEPAAPKRSLNELMAEIKAKKAAAAERIKNLVASTRGSAWPYRFGHLVVGADPHKASQWRVTRINTGGEPEGHEVALTHEAALRLASSFGADLTKPPKKALLKSGGWEIQ